MLLLEGKREGEYEREREGAEVDSRQRREGWRAERGREK